MFGPLGFWEVTFIVVLALLIFGPKKLPEVGRTVGRGMSEFRRATSDLKRTIEHEMAVEEQKPSLEGPRPVETASERTASRSDHRSGPSEAAASPAADATESSASEADPATAD